MIVISPKCAKSVIAAPLSTPFPKIPPTKTTITHFKNSQHPKTPAKSIKITHSNLPQMRKISHCSPHLKSTENSPAKDNHYLQAPKSLFKQYTHPPLIYPQTAESHIPK
ncbi:MAG: hypothetical protein HQL32_06565 [Planctomycetes bacterium]|nr:hypothetical protein [Planctomycetota bacterium]